MGNKSLKRVLQEVDPGLTVVSGGHHGHHRSDQAEWLAATGEVCTACKKEYLKGRDGLCMACWNDKQDKTIEIRDKTGALGFFGDSILAQITHQARTIPKQPKIAPNSPESDKIAPQNAQGGSIPTE